MPANKIFKVGCLSIVIGILIVCSFVIYLFIKISNDGIGYSVGSGLGSLADISHEKYKHRYLQKYADTLFALYPQYKIPDNCPIKNITSGYEFLNLTHFYFPTSPREVYSVQWEGTSFVSVRFAYNYETEQEIIENTRADAFISPAEKERIAKRLRNEILNKIDSIIATSQDKDSAIYVPPF